MAASSLRLVTSSSAAASSLSVGPLVEKTELPSGKIVELCGGPSVAQTSAAVALCVESQSRGDPVAWVLTRGEQSLYPPDLAEAGIDLEALVVVHVPPSDVRAAPRAAEILLRTGGFGAVVLDLSSQSVARQGPSTDAWMGRLLGLAREHSARLVVLSSSDSRAPSLGPLVSLRLEMRRSRVSGRGFLVEGRVLKDKSGAMRAEVGRPMRGPLGID